MYEERLLADRDEPKYTVARCRLGIRIYKSVHMYGCMVPQNFGMLTREPDDVINYVFEEMDDIGY